MTTEAIPCPLTILVKATGAIIDGVTIEETVEGQRDRLTKTVPGGLPLGALMEEGGVFFRTLDSRRDWFMKFSDFSFIFNRKVETK